MFFQSADILSRELHMRLMRILIPCLYIFLFINVNNTFLNVFLRENLFSKKVSVCIKVHNNLTFFERILNSNSYGAVAPKKKL